MRIVESSTKTIVAQHAGFFAALSNMLAAGALRERAGTRRSLGARVCLVVACVGVILLSTGLLVPSGASAAFTRPFLRQMAGTPAGPFSTPRGLAVDTEENLWVSDLGGPPRPPYGLDKFNSAEHENTFLETLKIEGVSPPVPQGDTPPESLAIDYSTGFFYITGERTEFAYPPFVEVFDKTGVFVKRFGAFGRGAHVAVDNSTEPLDLSAGSVYVAEGDGGPGNRGIEKLNALGETVSFEGCGTPCAKYVSGNRITGTPTETFNRTQDGTSPGGIAVDSAGDIYVANTNAEIQGPNGEESATQVDEYRPSGEFVRAFTGAATSGLGENHGNGGFGGPLQGIAVDPVANHLLVGVVGNEGRTEGEAAVDEFDIRSGGFLAQIVQTSSGHRLHGAFSLTTDSRGDLYVLNSGGNLNPGEVDEHAVDVYGPGLFDPTVRLGEATERTEHAAVPHGSVNPEASVNPEHSGLNECRFEYVTEAAFNATGFTDLSSGGEAPCVPAAASIPADEKLHPVRAEATGLVSGATYRYRLLARTAGALGGTAASESFAFTAPHVPAVVAVAATNISSTFADLHAQINPLGADTTYHFEYLTQGEFEANEGSWVGPHSATVVPVPDAAIGSGGETGSSSESVLEHIGGLAPATAYRFRVTATNEIGPTAGPDAMFATLPVVSPGLPDHRAYELLTPPDKGSAEDMFTRPETELHQFDNNDVGYPSGSGNRFLLSTRAAFGPFPASDKNAYVFSRTPAGWTYTAVAAPSLGVQSIDPAVFEPFELSRVGLDDGVGSKPSTAGESATNLLGAPGGPYAILHSDPKAGGAEHESTRIVGASRDLGHVVLESGDHGLSLAAAGLDTGASALYESSGSGECAAAAEDCPLIAVNPKGDPFQCGAVLGQGHPPGATHNAVSTDGSRIVFTAPDPYLKADGTEATKGCWNGATANSPQLYLRSGGTTVEVSKPEAGTEATRHPALYVGASEDDSRVFFLTQGELTKDDAGIHDFELYEWRAEGIGGSGGACGSPDGCLTRVSRGESGKAVANVWTVPAVSEAGSAVYFTADGVLAGGASPGSCHENLFATCALYRYDTETGQTAYVAAVRGTDYPKGDDWVLGTAQRGVEIALSPGASWYTTPDGRYLLFASTTELTGYRSTPAHPRDCPTEGQNQEGIGHCHELYRYDSVGSELTCVSCNPSGALPTSNAEFAHGAGLHMQASGPVRALSNDGSYAFFDTANALVPRDGNGTQDVYEWHAGTIALISSGQDSAASFFLGSSADGSNVFFGTHARLVPVDTDSAGDLYDARICTAADPCIQPPAGGTAQCEGGACQSPPPVPFDQSPASLTFSSIGNLFGGEAAPPKLKTAAQIKAERLARALRACRKDKQKRKRIACESHARKRYGPAHKARKSTRARKASDKQRASS